MKTLVEDYDIVVVGAGHAGCEAALAGARLGLKTIMFTVSVDSIALMPCNPNVGGSSKGHLVRELEKAGIKATIIGKATAGNDRVLLNEDERRFLEPPKTDELYKVIGR